jgi:hypothetical protein
VVVPESATVGDADTTNVVEFVIELTVVFAAN